VDTPDKWRLVYQLSHELTHVKMGVRTDNYLDETFAVDASFEVLRRFGYEKYLLMNKDEYLHRLPPTVQTALARERWREAQAYWIEQSKTQGQKTEDRLSACTQMPEFRCSA
jgi:hypothetical protein